MDGLDCKYSFLSTSSGVCIIFIFLLDMYVTNIRCFAFLLQSMCRDSRIVPGAAATEIELARKLKELFFKETGYFFVFSSCCNLVAI